MTVVEGIHALGDWLADEVCSKVEFKAPSNTQQTNKYAYSLVHPTVHKMYAPPQALAGSTNKELCPGIMVHLLDGEDHPRKTDRSLKFRLLIGVWNPGTHQDDVLSEDDVPPFVANADGWNDLWNFIDLILHELENAEHIGGILRVKSEDGFKFNPYKEDGVIVDFYPYYFGELEFSVQMAQAPPAKYYAENYL